MSESSCAIMRRHRGPNLAPSHGRGYSRDDHMRIWNTLTPAEVAIVIDQGGELPRGSECREARMAEAIELLRREGIHGVW